MTTAAQRGWRVPIVAALAVLASVAAVLLAQGLATSAQPGDQSPGQMIKVKCDQGQTIRQALQASRPGATIQVSGTCVETVTVTTDDIVLDGQGTAVLDGDGAGVALVIDGARRVVVRGLTVQNGTRGIDILSLATVTLEDVLVRGSRSHGVEVTNASVSVDNLTAQDNGRAGMIVNRNSHLRLIEGAFLDNLTGLVVYSTSSARLEGTSEMSGNATQGLTVGLGAVVFSLGSTVLANDNGSEGVLLLEDGSLELIGGRLEASGNGLDGVKVQQLSSLTVGIAEFGATGTAMTENNGADGVTASLASSVVVSHVMPLTSSGNAGSGLRLDDSTASVEASTLDGNGDDDVLLTFGARATLEGNVIGSIGCDATALSRGTTTCP